MKPGNLSGVMGRHGANDVGTLAFCDFARDIAEAEDANHPLLLVDDREAADLPVLHGSQRLADVIVGTAVDDPLAHDIANAERLPPATVGTPAAANVAVRDHSDQQVILADGNCANVLALHGPGGLHERCFRSYPGDALVHDLLYLHDDLHPLRQMFSPPLQFSLIWRKP